VAAAARRRHNLEVEDEGLLKDLIVIFVFVGRLYTVCFSFNARVLFVKKKDLRSNWTEAWLPNSLKYAVLYCIRIVK
jgi:hypothetical protein